MASIQTGIQLQDNFTNVILGIINSVNLAVSAMDDMNSTMSSDIDTASIQAARDQINQANAAAIRLNETFDRMTTQNVPATPAAPTWTNQSNIQIFNDTGVSRLTSEMSALNEMSAEVFRSQQRIDRQALSMEILPQNASWDINATNQRISELAEQMNNLNSIDINVIGADNAERVSTQYENIRANMNDIINLQATLEQAVQSGDVSSLNKGYTRLNSLIEQAGVRTRAVQQSIEGLTNIRWNSDTMPLFTSTGIERFQQEIQSANTMLQELSTTQNDISRQALDINVLPPQAVNDLDSLVTRIDDVRTHIQQIENNPVNIDTSAANSELERLREMLDQTLSAQEELNQSVQSMDVTSINESYLDLSQTIENIERYIRDNTDEQGRFNRSVQELQSIISDTENGFKGWQKAIIVANESLDLISSTLDGLGVMNMDGAFDRIDTMNDFQQTIEIMTGSADMANAALAKLKDTTLGTAYGLDVAASATQGFMTRGMSLGTAAEQVRIWADAVSFYGEGTNEQLESVVDAIGKMYSKGKVEADQLDRLFDAGIGAAEIYAQAVGENVSVVKDDLSDGAISAQQFISTVSQALDNGISAGAAKDAGDSWAVTFANLQAAITRGWVSVIENLDAALASQGLPSAMEMVSMFGQKTESVLNTVGDAMGFVVMIAANIGQTIGNAGSFIADNWSIIGPIVYGIAAALAVYAAVAGTVNAINAVSAGIKAAQAFATKVHAAAVAMESGETFIATVAQQGLNAALLACPITWIVLGVIALATALVILANHFSGVGHVAATAFGVICGWINVVIQFFNNLWLTIKMFAMGSWDAIGALCDNIQTAFHNTISNVQSFWYSLLSTVCEVIDSICRALNKLPFISFDYSGISQAASDYAAKSAEAANNKRMYVSISDAFNKRGNAYDVFKDGWISEAYKAGAEWGDGVVDKVKNVFKPDEINIPDVSDYSGLMGDANDLAGQTANNTGEAAKQAKRAADSMDITNEDLKYLRDIAETDYINRFTTAKITVNQTNHNNINNEMDLDGVTEHLRVYMEEQMASAAEGVH